MKALTKKFESKIVGDVVVTGFGYVFNINGGFLVSLSHKAEISGLPTPRTISRKDFLSFYKHAERIQFFPEYILIDGIKSIPAKQCDLPEFDKKGYIGQVSFDANYFNSFSYCMADNSDPRNRLKGLYFDTNLKRIVCTDGCRLSYDSIPLDFESENGFIIPSMAIGLIKRYVNKKDRVTLSFFEESFTISGTGVNVSGEYIDSIFPDYARVIQSTDYSVKINPSLFLNRLRKVKPYCEKSLLRIRLSDSEADHLSFDEGCLVLHSKDAEGGRIYGINVDYLIDVFRHKKPEYLFFNDTQVQTNTGDVVMQVRI